MHQPADETRLPCHRLARTDIASDAAARAQTEQDGRRRTEVTVRGEERRLQMQPISLCPRSDLSGADPADRAVQRKLAGTKAAGCLPTSRVACYASAMPCPTLT
eukprot:1228208-Rhodomonas_salina.1